MFKPYRRRQIAELRPYVPGENMMGISVSDADKFAGSPKRGDMIARNPKNYKDQWLVAAQYFAERKTSASYCKRPNKSLKVSQAQSTRKMRGGWLGRPKTQERPG